MSEQERKYSYNEYLETFAPDTHLKWTVECEKQRGRTLQERMKEAMGNYRPAGQKGLNHE